MRGARRRLEQLEDSAGLASAGGRPEDEREHRERRERIAHDANRSNERRRSEGLEPIFEVDEGGDVFCAYDGKPVTDFHQSLAEEWYWGFREWDSNPRGLIHDEATYAYYMPDPPHELAFSRERCYLPRFFWAFGDGQADPYCIWVQERLDVRSRGEG
jgi:hypothetical protein